MILVGLLRKPTAEKTGLGARDRFCWYARDEGNTSVDQDACLLLAAGRSAQADSSHVVA